ncbi:hypothetical protein ACNHUS_06615 [Actinomycetes bacterium M1A6_2h]
MTDHNPPHRPRPERPQVRVEPLREPVSDDRPRAVDLAAWVWTATLVALAATAALVGLDQGGIRATLRDTLIADSPDTSRDDIASTVDITMIASGAVALLVLILALMGIVQVRGRNSTGRTVLTVMAVVAAAGSLVFWYTTKDALAGATTVLPFAVALLSIAGTVPLFTGPVGQWLSGQGTLRRL